MIDEYSNFIEIMERILNVIKNEYDLIEKNYSSDKLLEKCLPIRASSNLDNSIKEIIELEIKDYFFPHFNSISPMIDSGIIELDYISEKINLNDIKDSKEISKLIYEGLDKLYIYKYVKYNMSFSFIIQLYLIFEKEFLLFCKKLEPTFNKSSLYDGIKFYEVYYNFKIPSKIKKDIDLYRNVINVYKHGYGVSYNYLKSSNPKILNNINANEHTFLFNLELINFYNLYNNIIDFLNLNR